MADYKLGSDDPKVRYDPGAGRFGSKKATTQMKALKRVIQAALHSPLIKNIFGENARNHLRYFLSEKGHPYVIETVEKMVKEVDDARRLYEKELAEAKKFVEKLPVGTHQITSAKASKGYNDFGRSGRAGNGGSRNWFFAVGGYSAWGKGTATVRRVAGGRRHYHLQYEYKFRDRYNWDKGKAVRIGPVTIHDRDMAEFHRQGLAKEFFMYGSWHHVVTWES